MNLGLRFFMTERHEWEQHPRREVYRDRDEIKRAHPKGYWGPERRYGDAGGYYRERGWGGERRGEGAWPLGGGLGAYGSGPYAGHGPKSYRQPDDRIREEVCERLTRTRRPLAHAAQFAASE